LDWATGRFSFTVPPQWEHRTNDVVFEGRVQNDQISGETTNERGQTIHWQGHRAPALDPPQPPKWGKPISLFNGHDITGWKPRYPQGTLGWRAEGGVLNNAVPGSDLVTERKFTDFKLHAMFRYPKGSNSGIYLRGRYEVQIQDDFGMELDSHGIGGVYGF